MMKRLSLMAGILGVLAFLAAPPTGAQSRPPRRPRKRPSFTIPRRW